MFSELHVHLYTKKYRTFHSRKIGSKQESPLDGKNKSMLLRNQTPGCTPCTTQVAKEVPCQEISIKNCPMQVLPCVGSTHSYYAGIALQYTPHVIIKGHTRPQEKTAKHKRKELSLTESQRIQRPR